MMNGENVYIELGDYEPINAYIRESIQDTTPVRYGRFGQFEAGGILGVRQAQSHPIRVKYEAIRRR